MNKKTIIVVIAGLAVILGYFFVREKPNVFAPVPKLPRSIAFQETGGGCGEVFVYKVNNDDTIGISVSANKEKLNLSATEKIFEIGKTDGLNVETLVGERIAQRYCNDVVYTGQTKPQKMLATSGKATISIDTSLRGRNSNYTTTVILKDVHFIEGREGDSDIVIDELIFKDVNVGWYPG